MNSSLPKTRFLPEYRGDYKNLIENLYLPVMKSASIFRCCIACFSLEAIASLIIPFQAWATKGVTMRILIRPKLSDIDYKNLIKTESQSEMIVAVENLLFSEEMNFNGLNGVHDEDSIRAFLKKNDFTVRVALEIPNCETMSLKRQFRTMTFVTDHSGNSLQFIENDDIVCQSRKERVVSVSWSWGDPKQSVNKKIKEFDGFWSGKCPSCKIVELPAHIVDKLVGSLFTRIIEGGGNRRLELFEHQKSTLDNWASNSFRGIFKMCTGAGKTVAALAGINLLQKNLSESGGQLDTVVVVCPTKILVEQWEKEIIRFGFTPAPLLAYDSIEKYYDKLGIFLNGKRHSGLRIVITTDVTFSKTAFANQVQKGKEAGTTALLVADEMHNYASKINTLKTYGDYFIYRIGLSATPEIEGDEYATSALFKYFDKIVGEYELADAISEGILCQYMYYPKPVFLDCLTSKRYYEIMREMYKFKSRSDVSLYNERSDLLRKSQVYLGALKEILFKINNSGETISNTLTFCPPGRAGSDQDSRLIEEVKSVYEEYGIFCSSITAKTRQADRPGILKRFNDGFFKVLLAIGCLDEGFDLPSTKRAIMLYSIDRERQFVQRRGRVLRKSKGKQYAIIHDIIVLPHNSHVDSVEAESLLEKELRRYRVFSDISMNREDARAIVDEAIFCAISRGNVQCSI